jgi:hypothetical protein
MQKKISSSPESKLKRSDLMKTRSDVDTMLRAQSTLFSFVFFFAEREIEGP